jgi:hypothetical protein
MKSLIAKWARINELATVFVNTILEFLWYDVFRNRSIATGCWGG